jgi:hypothetical protein
MSPGAGYLSHKLINLINDFFPESAGWINAALFIVGLLALLIDLAWKAEKAERIAAKERAESSDSISHLNEPVVLLHNEARTENHWLGVELVGRNHAEVVGARLILDYDGQTQTRFAKGGGSYTSSSERLVFGLGKATKIDRLSVIWPNGQRQEWKNLAIDCYHRLPESEP